MLRFLQEARNIKTVEVADGGGNLDNQPFASENWGAGHVLFSKTGQQEKVKPVKAMRNAGLTQISPPESPHSPQASYIPM
ncbi:MAG: hypothetical protein ACYCPD_16725 [Acidobacteriaceae bacterium]